MRPGYGPAGARPQVVVQPQVHHTGPHGPVHHPPGPVHHGPGPVHHGPGVVHGPAAHHPGPVHHGPAKPGYHY